MAEPNKKGRSIFIERPFLLTNPKNISHLFLNYLFIGAAFTKCHALATRPIIIKAVE